MCGIAGVFEYGGRQPVVRDTLVRMANTIVHRGPDDEGYFVRSDVGLASRRLSIIDIEGGHQPICSEDGQVALVFNGEIYNYQELRTQLLERGHQFRSRSDTEVILHLYEELGAACVDRLDGMFAFAIYDGRVATPEGDAGPRLLIARDRLGKKPIYYADTGTALVFGSELKTVLAEGRVSREIDAEALYHYLSLLVVAGRQSILRHVRKLQAGHLLDCRAGAARVRRYWNFSEHLDQRETPEREAVVEIRRLLERSVQKRLMSDVPLGAFLSGGIDSSTVVALMARASGRPVQTFSIGFEGAKEQSELPYARQLARLYGTDHHEFVFTPADTVRLLPELVRYADEPLAISSALPLYLLSRAARRHVKVALTGDGGDELFAGYEHYLYERWAALYRGLPPSLDRMIGHLSGGRVDRRAGRWRSRLTRFAAAARQPVGERRLAWGSGWTEAEKRSLLTPAALEPLNGISSPLLLESVVMHGSTGLSAHMQMDVLTWLPDEMLTKVDRMTMAASLEARCPLLDIDLTTYLARLRPEFRLKGGTTAALKRLLKRAVADLLPPSLLVRRKQGFNMPLDAWFRGPAREFVASTLSADQVRRRGIFDARVVGALIDRHMSGSINASNRLYSLLVFEIWAQEHLR